MIDRGAGSISNAAESAEGLRRGAKGIPAEIRGLRRSAGWWGAKYAVHCHNSIVERYL